MQFSRYNRLTFVSQPNSEAFAFELDLLEKVILKKIRQPPTFPCRRQHSIIGRLGLNHRVRDGNGCDPQAYRHRKKPETESNLFSLSRKLYEVP